MNKTNTIRSIIAVSLGTCFSLMGDASLYTILPVDSFAAGIVISQIGIILSANRFVRLILNGPVGILYSRLPQRPIFLTSLAIGACSTAIYAFTHGFWPLLFGRLLWGFAWAGIWVGGNTIILDISHGKDRGRFIGLYQFAFYLGAGGGALLGGLFHDLFGYQSTMMVATGLTLSGTIFAAVALPKMRDPLPKAEVETAPTPQKTQPAIPKGPFWGAVGLYTGNRLIFAGFFQSTLGLYLLLKLGENPTFAGFAIGTSTLTGVLLSLSTLIAMFAAPLVGNLSDRHSTRWPIAAASLLPGIAGFSVLSLGFPLAILTGIPIAAISSGANQSLATTIIGDLVKGRAKSRSLGVLFTAGDLGSAIGPPFAYALIPLVGMDWVYRLSAGIFLLLLIYTGIQARESRQKTKTAPQQD